MDPREDPAVEEAREPRRRASQAFGHDPARLVEYYLRLQEQYRERILGGEPDSERPGQDAA